MAYNTEDWNAALSSEIFREYLMLELQKKAVVQEDKPDDVLLDFAQTLEGLEQLEQKICQSPRLKVAFEALQKKFITDPEYTKTVDPKFVDGVLLLNLE